MATSVGGLVGAGHSGGGAGGGGAGGGGMGTGLTAEATVLPGLRHPAFPPEALVCLVGTKGGDITLAAAEMVRVGAEEQGRIGAEGGNGSAGALTAASGTIQRAVAYFSRPLSSMSAATGPSVGRKNRLDKVQIFDVAVSPVRPETLVVGTSAGIAIIDLEEENVLIAGTRHAALVFPRSSALSGVGVVSVEQSSVYIRSLPRPRPEEVPVGNIVPRGPVLAYRSPPALHMPAGEYYLKSKVISPLQMSDDSRSAIYHSLSWPRF